MEEAWKAEGVLGLGRRVTGLEEQSSLKPREEMPCPFATWILEGLLFMPPINTTFVLLDGLFGQCQVGVGQAQPLLQVTSPVLQRLQGVLRQLMSQGELWVHWRRETGT